MEKKFQTEFQIKLHQRNAAICNEFVKLKSENELASSWRVCVVISSKYQLTPYQVSNVVREAGLYIRKGEQK